MSILNQIHLKIGQEEEKNWDYQIYQKNWNSELAAFTHGFGCPNTNELA